MDNRSNINVTDAKSYWSRLTWFTLTKQYFRLQKDNTTVTNVCP